MNDRVTVAIPLAEVRRNMKSRNTPKGRQVEPAAREEIAALLAGREIRRDLLIEYLHLYRPQPVLSFPPAKPSTLLPAH